MQRLRRILVGVDFDVEGEALTAGSKAAAAQALRLARATGASVDFLHSIGDGDEGGPTLAADVPAWARGKIDGLLAEHGEGVQSSGLALTEERSWVALVRRAAEGSSDLVVVAKRNHTRRDDRRLGSVSMKLVRMCPGPVWVVKPEHELEYRCVLAATDLTPVGDLAVRYGSFMARLEQGCVLCVVHAWQRPMELQMLSEDECKGREKEIVDGVLKHLRGLPAIAELADEAQLFVGCDTPSHAILDVAEKKNPDLVVMGTISRGGIPGMVVGNTAEKLLYRLDCSILAIKPEDFVCSLDLERAL